jgi:hypothetical protein
MAGREEQGVLARFNEKTRFGEYINNLVALLKFAAGQFPRIRADPMRPDLVPEGKQDERCNQQSHSG